MGQTGKKISCSLLQFWICCETHFSHWGHSWSKKMENILAQKSRLKMASGLNPGLPAWEAGIQHRSQAPKIVSITRFWSPPQNRFAIHFYFPNTLCQDWLPRFSAEPPQRPVTRILSRASDGGWLPGGGVGGMGGYAQKTFF